MQLAGPSFAGSGGLAIHLLGDSITRGYGTKTFSDELPATDPFYSVRSIWSTGNLLLEENAAPFRMGYLSIGDVSEPDTPAELRQAINIGVIQSKDCVVLEDAGYHGGDPVAYRAQWINVANILRTVPDLHIVMMTMFDYPPAPINSQYDRPINGTTINQATVSAAREIGATLIDMNRIMDSWRNSAATQYGGLPVMHTDGVHPNLWGQFRMTGAILDACGVKPYLHSIERLWLVIERNYVDAGYGARNWTKDRAKMLFKNTLIPNSN